MMSALKCIAKLAVVTLLVSGTSRAQSLPVDALGKSGSQQEPAANQGEMRLRLMQANDRAREAESRVAELELRLARLDELLESMEQAAAINPVPQIEFADGNHMMLLAPMSYQVGNSGIEVTVPAGFVHDNASIPQALWSLLPPHGMYGKAAIVHDYLYWAQPCNKRKQADNLLMLAMIESNVGLAARTAVYRGVRLGGSGPYKANRRARDHGGIRVVPVNRREIPATATWKDYQMQLQREGMRDPAFPPDTGFCALGDQVEVPEIATSDD